MRMKSPTTTSNFEPSGVNCTFQTMLVKVSLLFGGCGGEEEGVWPYNLLLPQVQDLHLKLF